MNITSFRGDNENNPLLKKEKWTNYLVFDFVCNDLFRSTEFALQRDSGIFLLVTRL